MDITELYNISHLNISLSAFLNSSLSDLLNSSQAGFNLTALLDMMGGVDENVSFFDTYFSRPRFIVESVLASVCLLVNCMALISSANARNKRYSIYHILFLNLCVCNALSLTLTWLSNNSLFLFSHNFTQMMEKGTGLCQVTLSVLICLQMFTHMFRHCLHQFRSFYNFSPSCLSLRSCIVMHTFSA